MHIIVNGTPKNIEGKTLAQALVQLGYQNQVVATAVNGTFIAASARHDMQLNAEDRLEVLAPMQGG